MEKGQRVKLKIEDMSREGQGIGKSDGFALFVRDAVIGDEVVAEVTKVKKNYGFGRLVEVINPSESRIESQCSYSTSCGGCIYRTLSYERQLEIKRDQVENALRRIGEVDAPRVKETLGMDEPYHYRNKASMPVWTGGIITRKGGIVENIGDPAVGFYEPKSHQVVDCRQCLLQSKAAMAAADVLRQFMREDNITAYDPKWEKGLMRHLVVRTARGTGQVMVILVINGKGIPNGAKLVEMLDDAIYNLPPDENGMYYSLESVVLNINKRKTSQIMGEECVTLAGKPTIIEEIGGLKFEISPLSFYQVNPEQMVKLYDKAMEYADFKGGERVLDLYCGVGTIGIFAIKAGAGQVTGIEVVKEAVIDANRNAVINGIVNAQYICGRAEDELEQMDDRSADVAFLDPPRSGCDSRLLEAVAKAAPEKIVYISCDPATQARDIKILKTLGYAFVEATPVDMFPWTGAVETVALLNWQKATI